MSLILSLFVLSLCNCPHPDSHHFSQGLHHQLLKWFSWLTAVPLKIYCVHWCKINVLEKVLSSLYPLTQAPAMDFSCGCIKPFQWPCTTPSVQPHAPCGGVEGVLESLHKVIMWPWARHSAFLCLILLPCKIWRIIIVNVKRSVIITISNPMKKC